MGNGVIGVLSLARDEEIGPGGVVGESSKHLLIDGNNIGRAWGSTGKLWRKDAHAARTLVTDIAYSPTGMTADSLIEQWVAGSRDPADCVVATADRALKETLHAMGASTIGSSELRAWLDRAEQRVRRKL